LKSPNKGVWEKFREKGSRIRIELSVSDGRENDIRKRRGERF